MCVENEMVSRKMLPFKEMVQARFKPVVEAAKKEGIILDGELYCHEMSFQAIMSSLSDNDAVNDIRFYVFDLLPQREWDTVPETPFRKRLAMYEEWCKVVDPNRRLITPVEQTLCHNAEEVREALAQSLEQGYEGTMLKTPNEIYKFGRHTWKEFERGNGLLKMKPFDTLDAIIIDFVHKRKLTEEAKEYITDKDAFGRSKRGFRKDDRETVNEIGAITCEIPGRTYLDDKGRECPYVFNATFTKGSPLREEITIENFENYRGKWVEVSYLSVGIKNLPRHPRIYRTRPDRD